MERSENLGFYLPSRDTDDIADINQISENFKIIDKELSKEKDFVSYGDLQILTDEQKEQARENIGALSQHEAIQKPIEARNVLDEVSVKDNVYVNDGGEEYANTAYYATDYIYIPAGGSLAINGSARFMTVYDANKAVIKSEGLSAERVNPIFAAPSDSARYVRLTFRYMRPRPMVTRTALPQPQAPLDAYVTDYTKYCTKKANPNILKYMSVIDGYSLDSGGHMSQNTNYLTTDYIRVEAGESLAFTGVFKFFLAFDESFVPIGDTYVSVSITDFVFTAPADAARYVRVCVQKTVESNRMITRSSIVPAYAEYEDVFEDGVLLNDKQLAQFGGSAQYEYKNMLTGKKWYVCGDSFTADGYGTTDQPKFTEGLYAGKNKVYPFFIGNRCGMDVHNIAAGGKTLAFVDGYNNCFADKLYTEIPADADYITMYFGINDGHQNVPIGTKSDTTNTTFCGAWNVVLEHLIANHPFAHIGIIVSNGAGEAYVEATKQMAVKWGIPYLDLATDDQVPLLLRTLRDNVCSTARDLRLAAFRVSDTNSHPNAACHEYESRFIESWLMRL